MTDTPPAASGEQPEQSDNPLQKDTTVVGDEDEQYPPAHPTDEEPPELPDDEDAS